MGGDEGEKWVELREKKWEELRKEKWEEFGEEKRIITSSPWQGRSSVVPGRDYTEVCYTLYTVYRGLCYLLHSTKVDNTWQYTSLARVCLCVFWIKG